VRLIQRLAFVMAILVVVGNADSRPANAAAAAQSSSSRAVLAPIDGYDGETLYRGLAFGEGRVGALFPELDGIREVMAGHEDYADALVQEIATLDPTFFNRFALEVQSGDRVQIRSALREADDLGRVASSRIIVDLPQARMVSDQSDIVLLVLTAVVLFVLIVVVAAPTLQSQYTPLDRDIAADRIAEVLASA